jgi:transcriptional antiterminator RfaH
LKYIEAQTMAALQRDWYVVYSKPHKEEQVQLHLGFKGIESFFPRLQLPGRGATKRAITPLFPNYLFVRLDLSLEAHYVVWSPGVKRIVSCSDTPIPLDEGIVEFLKERADAAGVIQARSQLSAGQQVEITGGPFNGFVGIIENPPNAKGRVRVLLKLLSRQISVKLGVEFIRNQSVVIAPAAASSDKVEVFSSVS